MPYRIVASSPKAIDRITVAKANGVWIDTFKTGPESKSFTKYPMNSLHIGESLEIPIEGVNEASLRVAASNRSRNTGKKFIVLKHTEIGMLELARIE